LSSAITLRRQDCHASLAFRLAANVAYDAIDSDGIAPFIETLDHDIALVGLHRDRSPRAQFRAAVIPSEQEPHQWGESSQIKGPAHRLEQGCKLSRQLVLSSSSRAEPRRGRGTPAPGV